MKTYDFIVIGAGVVGCAIARELSNHWSVLVLERRERPGMETSQFNSGVVHSGIHLPPQFLKAKLARQGSSLIREYCQRTGVPNREVGMHIVVTARDCFTQVGQLQQFTKLLRRASEQDISIQFKTGKQIATCEPSIRCLFGIHIPGVRIIDQRAYVNALVRELVENGVAMICSKEVIAIEPSGSMLTVITDSCRFHGRTVINAAGLRADRIAQLCGTEAQHYFYRGEYYEIRPSAGVVANGLVYPIPPKHSKGLGIHLTPTTSGSVLLGPNTKRVEHPDDYRGDITPPEHFLSAVRSFLPNLSANDLCWAFSGIRPKITDDPVESDFIIEKHANMPLINLVGIESPGLTASLAIGRYVRQQLS